MGHGWEIDVEASGEIQVARKNGGVTLFEEQYIKFWNEFGKSKKMVLSTSFNDVVTSRMMSIVCLDRKLYFQTDKSFRKYDQLKNNPNVALCIDNIQIEGQCRQIGVPAENVDFCNAYKDHFASSFNSYSLLENERLFVVTPSFIERWLYIETVPHMEVFDVKNERYTLKQYLGV